jgi:type I restriction enzyme R subunit
VLRKLDHHKLFQVIKEIEDDPKVNKKKQPEQSVVLCHCTSQLMKTEVMVEHLDKWSLKKRLAERKAMVVSSPRLHAVRYKRI